MNLHVGFRAVVEAKDSSGVTLRLAASSAYRVFVNGEFSGYGPARAAHGYARIDEWPIAQHFRPGKNIVAIEVAGYNINSFYLPSQTSFLQAEVVAGKRVLAATGIDDDFSAVQLKQYVQKTQRYSFQRPFSEVYSVAPGTDDWRRDLLVHLSVLPTAVQPTRKLLPRRVPLPDFTQYPAQTLVAQGSLKREAPEQLWKDRSLTHVGEELQGFPESQLDEIPSIDLQFWRTALRADFNSALSPEQQIHLRPWSFATVDMGLNRAGFIGLHANCVEASTLYVTFDEVLTNGDVEFKRIEAVNAVAYHLQPGSYDLESFEPYLARYLKLIVLSGSCSVNHVHVRDYSNPDVWQADFSSSDPRLNRIFSAARETFRHNSVDLFTDCPSRERAAWVGDSFFTARAAVRFAGDTYLEKNFIENFALPSTFERLPEGMLPMLYPGDIADPKYGYIPTYPFWFILQLNEYAARSHDHALIEQMRGRVLSLFRYLEHHRNEFGLLENLPGWVFIEWSDASKYTDGVNFPANMLYAAALENASELYDVPAYKQEAMRVRDQIRKLSYDGAFFADHATRVNGELVTAKGKTEVCQYFAFYFRTATPEMYPQLWAKLERDFGPDRVRAGKFPEVAPANIIFGKLLRLELLSRTGKNQQLLDESIADFFYMAERTGTLWEHIDERASTDHGLMSHAVVLLYRDGLGIQSVDWSAKHVEIRVPDVALNFCAGTIPTPDGLVSFAWRKQEGTVRYSLELPKGYKATVSAAANLRLQEETQPTAE